MRTSNPNPNQNGTGAYYATLMSDMQVPSALSHFGFFCTTNEDVYAVLCNKLQSLLTAHWNYINVPAFYFHTSEFNHTKLTDEQLHILFFKMRQGTWTQEVIAQEIVDIIQQNKLHLYISNKLYTNLAGAVIQLLKQGYDGYDLRTPSKLNQVHESWYPNRQYREKLFAHAHGTLSQFIITKKLDLYVPAFSVVPIYHIRHYHRAYDLLTQEHHPNFIMTLPCEFQGEKMTILFPICAKYSRG